MIKRVSAKQLSAIEELHYDRQASENTYKVATSLFHNQQVEYQKREREIWADLSEIHGLDQKVQYKVEQIDGIHQIVPVEEV